MVGHPSLLRCRTRIRPRTPLRNRPASLAGTPTMAFSARPRAPRWSTFVLVSLAALAVAFWILPGWQPLFAQDPAAPAADAGAETPNLFVHIVKSAGPV